MSAYWRFRTFGFTPAQAKALAGAGFDIWFIRASDLGL